GDYFHLNILYRKNGEVRNHSTSFDVKFSQHDEPQWDMMDTSCTADSCLRIFGPNVYPPVDQSAAPEVGRSNLPPIEYKNLDTFMDERSAAVQDLIQEFLETFADCFHVLYVNSERDIATMWDVIWATNINYTPISETTPSTLNQRLVSVRGSMLINHADHSWIHGARAAGSCRAYVYVSKDPPPWETAPPATEDMLVDEWKRGLQCVVVRISKLDAIGEFYWQELLVSKRDSCPLYRGMNTFDPLHAHWYRKVLAKERGTKVASVIRRKTGNVNCRAEPRIAINANMCMHNTPDIVERSRNIELSQAVQVYQLIMRWSSTPSKRERTSQSPDLGWDTPNYISPTVLDQHCTLKLDEIFLFLLTWAFVSVLGSQIKVGHSSLEPRQDKKGGGSKKGGGDWKSSYEEWKVSKQAKEYAITDSKDRLANGTHTTLYGKCLSGFIAYEKGDYVKKRVRQRSYAYWGNTLAPETRLWRDGAYKWGYNCAESQDFTSEACNVDNCLEWQQEEIVAKNGEEYCWKAQFFFQLFWDGQCQDIQP
ncbi:hypothetical protein BDK51DRAFT_33361, partial [Blyttiomyces helicus]